MLALSRVLLTADNFSAAGCKYYPAFGKHMYYLDAKISNHNWIDET